MGSKKEQHKTEPKRPQTGQKNKELYRVMYIFMGLFLLLFGYFAYFLLVESKEVINNPYNLRQENFTKWVVRGNILDSDGNILAETLVDENGEEIRYYPYGNLYAHVLGYSQIGKTGIEREMNFQLLTSDIPVYEKLGNDFMGKKSQGNQVVTTLDTTLQKTAYEALGNRNGAVVVLEPSTGRILAMVSKPDYDPNEIIEIWEELTASDSTESLLLNRATQGLYPPGSTFKMVTVLEYKREFPDSYNEFQYICEGKFALRGAEIRCYHGKSHGELNLTDAFAKSCNGAFAEIGSMLSINSLSELCNTLLFNQSLPLSLEYQKSSFVLENEAQDWEILQTAVGQGQTLVTPIHQAMITASIANGGILMKPYVVDSVLDAYGNRVKKYSPEIYASLMTTEEAACLTEWMKACVEDGTGYHLNTDAYTAAGKTGTAEWDETKESHAWFVGFAPADKPQIVVSIVIEEGGAGSDAAAMAARKILDAWAQKKK